MGNKKWTKWVNLGLAVVIGGGVSYVTGSSVLGIPAVAPALSPGQAGMWAAASESQLLPTNETLSIPGLEQQVEIVFEQDGTPHVKAQSNRDAWLAIGYLHAKFRLPQMDMMRRQGAGLLSEVLGPSAVAADQVQRILGLERTAQANWDAMQPNDEIRQVLEAYAAGVNAVIDQTRESGEWPLEFKMFGYEPEQWRPQDSLIMQGVLAQMMSFNTQAASQALMVDTLGYEQAMKVMPQLPVNKQSPYDKGPYQQLALDPMPISPEQIFMEKAGTKVGTGAEQSVAAAQPLTSFADATVAAAVNVLEMVKELPVFAIHENSNSNGWVVDGTKTESGKPLLSGDPHLSFTVPSIWYQIDVDAPDYKFAGATVPGLPFALIGRNEQTSWTMTNGQTQQTFFYREKTDEEHPDQYFWQGEWHDMSKRVEKIPVKGQGEVVAEIKSTIHGPIINTIGEKFALTWVGAMPSNGLEALRKMMQMKSPDQFKSALSDWSAPAMNFLYADKSGNIGAIAAGAYPQFDAKTKPWLPMSGTGEDDIRGKIPYAAIPQEFNPEDHVIGSANQRMVTNDYPYFIGGTQGFDHGYRANRIYEALAEDKKWSAQDFVDLQADVKDTLAASIRPALLKALASEQLGEQEKQALSTLSAWDLKVETEASGASIWWVFWDEYLKATYGPWWEKHNVPAERYAAVAIDMSMSPLSQNLEQWTLHEPTNEFFNNPVTGEKRDANAVMKAAFKAAVTKLSAEQGANVSEWKWGKLHTALMPAVTKLPGFGVDPYPAPGDVFTLNVGDKLQSEHGPTWRMVVDMGTDQAIGIYPGGQSNNPLSPWYLDRLEDWKQFKLRPMLNYGQAEQANGGVLWSLQAKK